MASRLVEAIAVAARVEAEQAGHEEPDGGLVRDHEHALPVELRQDYVELLGGFGFNAANSGGVLAGVVLVYLTFLLPFALIPADAVVHPVSGPRVQRGDVVD